MNQTFHPGMNTIARVSILAMVLIATGLAVGWYFFVKSPYMTQVNMAREQPVPFSHQHHVTDLGIDCRYCHTSVEDAAFAGIPPTQTCMTCHSQIHPEAEMLAPVRTSYSTGLPLKWTRVHNLSDFVYFNHSIHLNKGVACETCHGRVDQMPLAYKAKPMFMEWCVECHRAPEKFIRPREEVLAMGYEPENQLAVGTLLVKEYNIETGRLDNCSICHR
ncbi:MAG: cytochrome c3 family protein [Anaerolineae bacterium]|nr:cytochrome c3 family protein [Anaerolineae bacterium]